MQGPITREELDHEKDRMDQQIQHLKQSDTALNRALDANYKELNSKMTRLEAKMDKVLMILEGRAQ